ncbi:MAG: DUF2029 domain-containing protein [candidate division Zixibacteria bacterium]|nr:DUF2029 domain-containing protein [candidate division Zixibacteria bacterium]
MAPISVMPDYLGLVIWNLINTMPLFFAVKLLNIEDKKKALILWIILMELVTSLQNCQSNGLYAAMFILTFALMERDKGCWAALVVVLAMYIKLFGAAAGILFIFYPRKTRFLLYLVIWFIVIGLLPLLVVSVKQLLFLYGSWYNLLTRDAVNLVGLSVMGISKVWFGLILPNTIAMIIGLMFLLAPLIKIREYGNSCFRHMFLCSLLIWIIIFNYKAESPMFIIAVVGIAVWYMIQDKSVLNNILLWLTLILTSFSAADLFPIYLRTHFIKPYLLKAVPCFIVWVVIQCQLWFGTDKTSVKRLSNPL